MLSRLYAFVIARRNRLYDAGFSKTHSLGAKTVSVGNITVGGTGKTPLVARVAEILAERGETVCILTRGYGRANPTKRVLVSDGAHILADVKYAGDEPFELAEKLLNKALIVADGNRVAAAHWARPRFGVTRFVLDDGFQHRRARRDLDIVCVDATEPFGNGETLPGGILREPIENLKRADVVVVTRANLSNEIAALKLEISKHNPHCPIFVSENRISNLIDLKDFPAKAPRSPSEATDDGQRTADKFLAFCALGNPNNFFEQLHRENFRLAAVRAFPDHHFYTAKDVRELAAEARRNRADVLLTTAKDAVKLKDLKFDVPCLVVENELVFERDEEFRQILLNL